MGIDPGFARYCSIRGKTAFDPSFVEEHNPVVKYASDGFNAWVECLKLSFPKVPKLHAGLTEDVSFGAAADIWNDGAYIRVHCSVPTIIANLVIATFSHYEIMSVDKLDAVPIDPNGIFFGEEHLVEELFNNGRLLSIDAPLQEDVVRISVSLCSFIFFHEFTHIRNGHVDLFQKSVGLLAMEETESEISGHLAELDRHATEWDADKVAHMLSSDIALSTILGRCFTDCSREQISKAFFVYHVMLYLLFKLMEAAEPKRTMRVHPTPLVRIMFLLVAAPQLATSIKIDDLDPEFSTRVLFAGEKFWGVILKRERISFRQQAEAMEAQMSDATAIFRQWNLLRDRLAPYNRGTTDLARPIILKD